MFSLLDRYRRQHRIADCSTSRGPKLRVRRRIPTRTFLPVECNPRHLRATFELVGKDEYVPRHVRPPYVGAIEFYVDGTWCDPRATSQYQLPCYGEELDRYSRFLVDCDNINRHALSGANVSNRLFFPAGADNVRVDVTRRGLRPPADRTPRVAYHSLNNHRMTKS